MNAMKGIIAPELWANGNIPMRKSLWRANFLPALCPGAPFVVEPSTMTIALAGILFALSGCSPDWTSRPSKTISSCQEQDRDSFSRNVGTVLAGQEVEQLFRLKNQSAEPMAIDQESDIQRNCGCSSIIPAKRHLAPGEETEVTVKVRTNALGGPFDHGGRLIWTFPDKRKKVSRFSVSGHAQPAFTSAPDLLLFHPQDITHDISKEIIFSSTFPIDWASFAATASSEHFQVTETVIDANGARCRVRCTPPEDDESIEGHLYVRARMHASDSDVPAIEATSIILLRASHCIDLTITPKNLTFDLSKRDGTMGKLLLRGELLRQPMPVITRITSPSGKVSWQLHLLQETTAAILELRLAPSTRAKTATGTALIISLRQGRTIRVPILIINNHNVGSSPPSLGALNMTE